MSHQFARALPVQKDPEAAPAAQDVWSAAPFAAPLAAEVRALVGRLSPAQQAWLSGYLAGLVGPVPAATAAAAVPGPQDSPVVILFGSQSGNGEGLARRAESQLAARGVAARVLDMLDCRKTDLEAAKELLVIVSTHGDGDPPERAVPLFELLGGRRAPRLAGLRYSVLALGDRSYEQFCAAGQKLDAQLEKLGATHLAPRVECDVDFEAPATAWIDAVAAQLAQSRAASPVQVIATAPASATIVQAWTRKHPFQAGVLANQPLTMRGSSKDVRHVELALDGSGIQYEPGDALGIVPANDLAQVDSLIGAMGLDPHAAVQAGEHETELRTALTRHFEIGTVSVAFLRRYAEATGHAELKALVADRQQLGAFTWGRDVLDVVAQFPAKGLDAATFAPLLSPLAPRLYSIASSHCATPDEVHLTVGVVRHAARRRERSGVVSGAIAGLADDAELPVYLHRNEGFRLPADPATPIVMIGAGTGVAPYRGFMAERECTGATGRNWLLFGDRSFEFDFLYQAEWLAWRRSGLLSRIDVAFSRDQAEKIYVQHRLREHGAEVWRWLQDGAHLYLCGDASRMAVDVEKTLLDVFATHGSLAGDEATEYLRQLQRERRYQKDVY